MYGSEDWALTKDKLHISERLCIEFIHLRKIRMTHGGYKYER